MSAYNYWLSADIPDGESFRSAARSTRSGFQACSALHPRASSESRRCLRHWILQVPFSAAGTFVASPAESCWDIEVDRFERIHFRW